MGLYQIKTGKINLVESAHCDTESLKSLLVMLRISFLSFFRASSGFNFQFYEILSPILLCQSSFEKLASALNTWKKNRILGESGVRGVY